MFSSGLKFRRVWFDFELRILSIFQQLVVCWENFSGEEQPCRSVRCKYMYIFHIKWWNNDETFPFDTSPLHPDRLRSTNMLIVLIFDGLQYFNSSKFGHGAPVTLQWRHNGRNGVSNHQPHDCLLNRLFRCRSMKTPKLRVTGPCAGNSPVTGEFAAQRASNAENVSIWWRHLGNNSPRVSPVVLVTVPHNKSTLVQVMAWCCQATNHYLRQCWAIYMLSYGVTSHTTSKWVALIGKG